MSDQEQKDAELGRLVREILEKSSVLDIKHSYEAYLGEDTVIAHGSLRCQKNGHDIHFSSDEGVRSALRLAAASLENGKPMGQLHVPR